MRRLRRLLAPDGRSLAPVSVLALLLPFAGLMLFAFLVPILSLLSISVLEPQPTLANYGRALSDRVFADVMVRTLEIAFAVSVTCLAMAFPVALLMARSSGAKLVFITACIVLPLWSSVLVRTTAWAVLLQRNGLINTALQFMHITDGPVTLLFTRQAVVLAMTHVLLPFMVLPIYGSLRAIPADFGRAAAILGASRWRTLREVTIPLALPGILSGFLMVFLVSLGYFITPALLGSPREMMVATLISQQITMLLDWPFGAALVGVLTVFVLVIAAAFGKVARFSRAMGAGA